MKNYIEGKKKDLETLEKIKERIAKAGGWDVFKTNYKAKLKEALEKKESEQKNSPTIADFFAEKE